MTRPDRQGAERSESEERLLRYLEQVDHTTDEGLATVVRDPIERAGVLEILRKQGLLRTDPPFGAAPVPGQARRYSLAEPETDGKAAVATGGEGTMAQTKKPEDGRQQRHDDIAAYVDATKDTPGVALDPSLEEAGIASWRAADPERT